MTSKNIMYSVLFVLLLFLSLAVRSFVFFIPHKGSDEVQYMGLAYKLEKHGTDSYNLRGLYTDYTADKKLFVISDSKQENSSYLLDNLPAYYDEPLFHKPPGLPFLIMLSHKVFAAADTYAGGVDVLKGKTKELYGQAVFKAQLYASFICFFFSLATIVMVFVVVKYFFDTETGLYSAFLFSVSPINIMISSRLWTDGIALCFMLAALYLYFRARDGKNMGLAFFSGVFCAAAVLTRTVAFSFVFILLAAETISFVYSKKTKQDSGKKAFCLFICFFLTVFFLSFPWFAALFKEYGTPFYFPAKDPESLANNNWLKMISGRSAWLYLANPLVQCPLLILFYWFFIKFKKFSKAFNAREKVFFANTVLLLLFAGFLGIFFLLEFKELRYVLPAVFVMTVYSGAVLKEIRKYFFGKTGVRQAKIMLFSLLGLCAWWSISLAKYFIDTNSVIMVFPF